MKLDIPEEPDDLKNLNRSELVLVSKRILFKKITIILKEQFLKLYMFYLALRHLKENNPVYHAIEISYDDILDNLLDLSENLTKILSDKQADNLKSWKLRRRWKSTGKIQVEYTRTYASHNFFNC